MPIKNATASKTDELRDEYDLSKLSGGVQGKYYERATAGTTLVLLEPDVAEAFPDARTVNQALRALIKVAERQAIGGQRNLTKKPLQPTNRSKRSGKKRQSSRAARG